MEIIEFRMGFEGRFWKFLKRLGRLEQSNQLMNFLNGKFFLLKPSHSLLAQGFRILTYISKLELAERKGIRLFN